MRFNAFLILFLLTIVIAAPVADATICPECNDAALLLHMSQQLEVRAGHSIAAQLHSDTCGSTSQKTDSAQDLCPVCSNIAAAMVSACCGAPTMISHTNHLPKLFALSNLSYPINKPPQN